MEVLNYLILIPNIYLAYLNKMLNNMIFDMLISVIHFGYITWVALLIMKYKLNNYSSRISQAIRIAIILTIPKRYTKYIFLEKSSFKTFVKWKLIYRSLNFLRSLKLN